MRTKVLTRYIKFFKSLLKSPSPEVVLVANLAARDMGSTTGINMARLKQETGLNPWVASSARVKEALEMSEHIVPEADLWRLPLLEKLILTRSKLELNLDDTSYICELIESLCSS